MNGLNIQDLFTLLNMLGVTSVVPLPQETTKKSHSVGDGNDWQWPSVFCFGKQGLSSVRG